jgi:hypothetical protein
MIETEHFRAANEQAKAHAAEDRRAALNRMADDFESNVGSLVGLLSAASTELEATARSMTGSADRGDQQATTVASLRRCENLRGWRPCGVVPVRREARVALRPPFAA